MESANRGRKEMKPSEAIENIEYARRWLGSESDFSEEALDMAIFALKKLEQDRWIPVTERLPKPNTNVIMQCRAKGYKEKYRYFQTIGCYIPALTVKSEEKWNDDCEGVEIYDEKTDSFYCKEGWYEETTQGDGDYMSWYMGANVIAWRPLPEAYTEEEV